MFNLQDGDKVLIVDAGGGTSVSAFSIPDYIY